MKERGDGRIFQRGRRYWIGYYIRGQELRESSESQDRRVAVELLRTRLAEARLGHPMLPAQRRLTVAQALDGYVEALRLNGAKGLATIETRARMIREALGGRRVSELTAPELRRWLDAQLVAGYARDTAKNHLAVLRAAVRRAHADGLVATLPVFPSFTGSPPRTGFLEADEYRAIRAHLDGPEGDVADFLHLTGWRTGEALYLVWESVERGRCLRLSDSKTGDFRVLPLVGQVGELIERRWRARAIGCPFVFHKGGRVMTRISNQWSVARRLAGLPTKRPHDLRRTAMRDMLEHAHLDLKQAMSLTGHRDPKVAMHYRITDSRSVEGAVLALERARHDIEGGHNADTRAAG